MQREIYMRFFLGVDVSTTATKALLIEDQGKVVAISSSRYDFKIPQPLWSEQHPDLWWEGAVNSIREVLTKSKVDPSKIHGIGLTGQMHGLVLLDKSGEVIRPAILWNDQRTGVQCDDIRERLGKEHLIQVSGNDALTGFTAPKILWVQQEEPDLYNKVVHILLPKDFVRLKLTGDFAIDKAGGAGMLLFDVRERSWSPEILEALQIDPCLLPPTFEGTEQTGQISSAAAEVTGLHPGTPVFGGGGDQAAAAVGTGAVEEGIISLSLGTSGVVFATTDQLTIEPDGRLHAFCHAVPGKWHLMGVMLSAAGSLRWHRDTFRPDSDIDGLVVEAGEVPPGSDGLIFLPYLTGERTPYPDPFARGAYIGLTVRHTLPHMTRSVLEGVAFGLRDIFELMKSAGLSGINQVRLTGGGAKSEVWRQILADILGAELVTVNSEEGAAYGAAILAATGAGMYQDVPTACKQCIQVTGGTTPGINVEAYDHFYPLYRELYPALSPTFNAIAKVGN